jgi:hypothetical protein
MDTKTAVGEDRSGQTKPVGLWEGFWLGVPSRLSAYKQALPLGGGPVYGAARPG